MPWIFVCHIDPRPVNGRYTIRDPADVPSRRPSKRPGNRVTAGLTRAYARFRISCDCSTAIDDNGLSGHEGTGLRREEDGGARDLVGLADAMQRCVAGGVFEPCRVLPQGAGE